MAPLFIGYARVSTDEQGLTAQRDALAALGVSTERVYVDHGLTGTNRDRPGLREALAACREGDTLVVTKARPDRALAARRTRDPRRRSPLEISKLSTRKPRSGELPPGEGGTP